MSGFVARSVIVLALLMTQAEEYEPLLHGDTVGRMSLLAERPHEARMVERAIWFEALVDASIPLLRAYLNERVLFGDLPTDSEAEQWWSSTLLRDPAALAAAFAHSEPRYVMWDLSKWPESLEPLHLPYRVVLVEAMFEVYLATKSRVDRLHAQIAEFAPVDRFPGGLPGNTDPAWVKDPELRAQVQRSIDELARQSLVKQELDRAITSAAELSHVPGRAMRILYSGAAPEEMQALADLIAERRWTGNDLYLKIIEDWPELSGLVAEASRQP
jgi:hypothetical protein